MAYKLRGRLDKKIKACEMEANDFSLVTLTRKFAALCGGPVAIQYKGRTFVSDADVQAAVDECLAQLKPYVEVDLLLGSAGTAAQAPAAQAAAVRAPEKRAVAPLPVAAPEPARVDAAAETLLAKYGLSSPRNASSSSTSSAPAPAPAPAPVRAASPRQEPPPPARPVQPQVLPEVTRSAPASRSRTGAALRGGAEGQFRADINRLRTQPRTFAALLEQRAAAYEGTTLRLKRGTVMFRSQTHEGARACLEAKSYLESIAPVGALDFPVGLAEAAREIVHFMGPAGDTRPTGDDVTAIIARNGEYEGTLSQVIAYVYEDDVLATVLDLLVCDGDATRHTAKLLLNPKYQFAGIACGEGSPKLVVMQFVTESWSDTQ